MKINVTEQDIEMSRLVVGGGQPWSSQFCPIAIATRRATGINDVHVLRTYISLGEIRSTGFHELIDLPQSVQAWIDRFDLGRSVEPFEFELEREAK